MRNLIFKSPNLLKLVIVLCIFAFICIGCGGGGSGSGNDIEPRPTGNTTLTVRTFMNSLEAPATSDVVVKINGVEKGVTGSDGSFTTLVDPGTVEVRVYIAGLVGGHATVELDQGESETVDVIMGGNGLVEMTTLSIDQFENGIQGNILDQDFGALTLRFVDDAGKTVVLVDVDEIAIWPLNGGSPVKLTSLFALQSDGTMEADDVEGIRNALKAVDGEVELRAMGDDPEGLVHDNSVKFHIGRFTLDVSVVAPPSNPALPVGIVPVKATLLGLGGTDTEIIFNATSDSSGNFTLTSIPIGSLDFEATVEDGGKVYNGFGILPMDGDKTILLALLTTEDVLNGEQSITVTSPSLPGASVAGASKVNPGANIVPQAGFETTVTATGGAENIAGTDTATLIVPEGTQTVTLEYMVSSAEYPTYVNKQSQYDDVWQLMVIRRDGFFIFDQSSRVNAMLNNPPVWQSNGTTGIISEELDVSDLTTVQDTPITLFASSTNVGDAALATTVTATLTFEPDFNISQARPYDIFDEFYSLPEFAEGNTFHRTFRLKLTGRPLGADIESVAVNLFQETDDTNLIPVMYPQGVDDVLVKEIDKNLLEVRVTTDDAFVLSPAPVHKIQFRFTVKIDAGGTMLEDTKDSGGSNSLFGECRRGSPVWDRRARTRRIGMLEATIGLRRGRSSGWRPILLWLLPSTIFLGNTPETSGTQHTNMERKLTSTISPTFWIRRENAAGTTTPN